MTTEHIKSLHSAKPFRPFTIHIADGSSVEVSHPEIMIQSQGGRTVIVSTQGEEFTILDLLLVTKVTLHNGAERKRRK